MRLYRVVALVGLVAVGTSSWAREPKEKIYEYITEFAYREGRVEMRHEIHISDSRENFSDSYKTFIRNKKSKEWVFQEEDALLKFTKLSYTKDLTPGISFDRPGLEVVRVGKKESMNSAVHDFQFIDADLEESSFLDYKEERENIQNNFSWAIQGDNPPKTGSNETVNAEKPAERVHENKTISEGDHQFTITLDKNVAVLRRDDGSSVRFPKEELSLPPSFEIDNGILSLNGNARQFDLRMFDAEVKFIGDTEAVQPVKGSDDGIDPRKEFDTLYPDLVAKERRRLALDRTVKIEEDLEATSRKIIAALKIKKSVKLLGAAGSGKTSEIKALARLVAAGKIKNVPRTAEIRAISLGALSSGTKYTGEIQTKLEVILEYGKKAKPILMIDEAHVLASTGVAEGVPANAGQYLKPALEEGEIRMIGISTNQEWDNAFANDTAFDQRFEEVVHQPPTGAELRMKVKNSFVLKGLPVPEDASIDLAIALSDRFSISGAQPRKAVNLLLRSTTMMEELGKEGLPASIEAVQRSAVETYRIDPAFFDSRLVSKRLTEMKGVLASQIVGQKEAIQSISDLWFRKLTNVGSLERANGILFYGPPGTGKTLTATLSAKAVGYKSYRIEMNKYSDGNIEAFRYEVFRALRESPNTVIILDEFDKASMGVQNAVLSMMQPGSFTVNFRDPGGRHVFEEVNSSNAVFCLTTNAGQSLFETEPERESIGFAAKKNTVTKAKKRLDRVEKRLVDDGISEPVLSRLSAIVGLPRPNAEEFRIALSRSISETLLRESARHGVKFRLSGKDVMIAKLMDEYEPGESDYRDIGYLIQKHLEPFISQSVVDPNFAGAKVIRVVWSSEIDTSRFPSSEKCEALFFKPERALSNFRVR